MIDLMTPGSTQFRAEQLYFAVHALVGLGFDLDDYAIRFDTRRRGYNSVAHEMWVPFSWEIFDRQGYNIATYGRDMMVCTIQPGHEGKGRIYGFPVPLRTGEIISQDGCSRTMLDYIGGMIGKSSS